MADNAGASVLSARQLTCVAANGDDADRLPAPPGEHQQRNRDAAAAVDGDEHSAEEPSVGAGRAEPVPLRDGRPRGNDPVSSHKA